MTTLVHIPSLSPTNTETSSKGKQMVSILSPTHPDSVSLVQAITSCMDTKGITRAEIVTGTHLSARALGKKLNHQSQLMVRDFFAIARILGVSPSELIAAADS